MEKILNRFQIWMEWINGCACWPHLPLAVPHPWKWSMVFPLVQKEKKNNEISRVIKR